MFTAGCPTSRACSRRISCVTSGAPALRKNCCRHWPIRTPRRAASPRPCTPPASRAAIAHHGGDPQRVNATVPITLVVDHSLQVDAAGSKDAETINLKREFERNGERYRFLKWAEQTFDGLQVFPPGAGIIHQIHLEQVAAVTLVDDTSTPPVAFPDFAIGGDSHTPMV